MKKMNVLVLVLGFALAAISVAFSAAPVSEIQPISTDAPIVMPATPTTPAVSHPNGVQTARAFLANGKILALNCGFRFTVIMPPGDSGGSAEGEFTLAVTGANRGYITRMLFNGNELIGPNDPPLPGFPFFSAPEIKDLNIWVNNVKTPNDTANIYGNFYAQEFKPQTPIVITLHPGWLPIFVPYAGGNAGLSVRWVCGENNGSGGTDYDLARKGFLIWVDPTMPYRCEVYDRNNPSVIIDRFGPYVYGQTLPGQANDSSLNVAYQDGIKMVDASSGWCVMSAQKPEALAQDGVTPAAVYSAHIPVNCGMSVDIDRLPIGAEVKVFGYVETGELPAVPVTYQNVVNNTGVIVSRYAYAQVSAGAYPALIVQVTGATGFDIYFYRISPTTGGSDGKG